MELVSVSNHENSHCEQRDTFIPNELIFPCLLSFIIIIIYHL